MRFKEGVNPFGIKNELMIALIVTDGIYIKMGHELVITSLNDSKHSHASLHYAGYAADIRTRMFTEQQKQALAQTIREALGNNPDYDIVVESTHIHMEYQPKYRGAPS